MSQLLRFPSSVKGDPAIEAWMHDHSGELGAIAALVKLIETAYTDMKGRLEAE